MARRIATHQPEVPENPTVVASVSVGRILVPVLIVVIRIVIMNAKQNIMILRGLCVQVFGRTVGIVTILETVRLGRIVFPKEIPSVNHVKLSVQAMVLFIVLIIASYNYGTLPGGTVYCSDYELHTRTSFSIYYLALIRKLSWYPC